MLLYRFPKILWSKILEFIFKILGALAQKASDNTRQNSDLSLEFVLSVAFSSDCLFTILLYSIFV